MFTTRRVSLFLFLAISCFGVLHAQVTMTTSLTRNASVLFSPNAGNLTAAKAAVIDGNDTTMWQSGGCFPTNFIIRADMNPLYWRCNTSSACTASNKSTTLYGATDGAMTTASASIALAGSQAWLRISLPAPITLYRVGIRFFFPGNPAPAQAATVSQLSLEFANGTLASVLKFNSSQSYNFVPVIGNWSGVVAVYVNSSVAFSVTELAAQSGPCLEWATVDLGAVQEVGIVRTRYWPSSCGLSSWLLASVDGTTFVDLVPTGLDTTKLDALTVSLPSPTMARYISVRHRVAESDWCKVYVWGIDAWPAPPPPPPAPAPPPPPPPSGPTWPVDQYFAGTVRSFSYNATVTVSSNPDPNAMAHILDGNDNSQWQSDACYPTGYTTRPAWNPLLRLCNGTATASLCTASVGSSNLAQATDTSVYTSATIQRDPATGLAFFAAAVPGASRTVSRVTVKGWYNANANVSVVLLIRPSGAAADQRLVVGELSSAANHSFNWVPFLGQWADVVGVRLESTADFMLTEVAMMAGVCVEEAVVDLGEIKAVGVLRFRYWSLDAEYSSMAVSADGVNWTTIRDNMDPSLLSAVEIYLPNMIYIRYMRIRHKVKEDANWRKVYVWGIDAYDYYGRWGAPPTPSPHPKTLREVLGLNGIWGWGQQKFSTTLVKEGKGPLWYNAIASWGRNYHNMNWDVKKPGNNPKYETMSKTGTDGQWWLDWDKEYAGWKAAGMKVDASFQFTDDVFPPSQWGANITATAYYHGYAFGKHFGPSRAPANVSLDAVEVGNEPWIGFNASVYSQILRGFAQGIKDADPNFRLLPCALQANNPYGEDGNNGNFIGARIPPDVAPRLDVINLHVYSWYRDPEQNNTNLGVHPEHRGSSMNGLNNMLHWRDANMPGKPVWVTEWGWDAHMPGEVCNTTLCVSQHAQALYGIRGLMVLARKGVELSHWFFYANADEGTTVFTRSGVRSSNATNFVELPVFTAFKTFLQAVGSTSFLGVAAERPDLYAYFLGPAKQPGGLPSTPAKATHLLAWRPVAAGEGPDEPLVDASLDWGLQKIPGRVWTISGRGLNEATLTTLVKTNSSSWTLSVSAIPLLVQLYDVTPI